MLGERNKGKRKRVNEKDEGSESGSDEKEMIRSAIADYHKLTCIKFVPRTSADRDYIYFNNGNTGCWSSVGRVGGRQESTSIDEVKLCYRGSVDGFIRQRSTAVDYLWTWTLDTAEELDHKTGIEPPLLGFTNSGLR
ncbi:hypothetical protein M8J77_016181 [Diaphorina citri]|nr:hypothetical protein M8J77_016181 [Diaphorina citri]